MTQESQGDDGSGGLTMRTTHYALRQSLQRRLAEAESELNQLRVEARFTSNPSIFLFLSAKFTPKQSSVDSFWVFLVYIGFLYHTGHK